MPGTWNMAMNKFRSNEDIKPIYRPFARGRNNVF
ncbi:Uncharacterised protein [Avibacterium paragallinarum]|uniref:Uncharacterized protein n=1 Tax=Avibacterium paragallinarum TaxID=728 RepID=A0A380Z003_AVIPA|nr:Uncharacterised protein [Avibacterium paragallinarum]